MYSASCALVHDYKEVFTLALMLTRNAPICARTNWQHCDNINYLIHISFRVLERGVYLPLPPRRAHGLHLWCKRISAPLWVKNRS